MRDTSAWKVDNKAWVKERKAKWKEVKRTIDLDFIPMGRPKATSIKAIKQYFLTGKALSQDEVDEFGFIKVDPERPLSFLVDGSLLLECWLAADQSEAEWERIKASYAEDYVRRSREAFRKSYQHYPDTGSLFNGLEERLYFFLRPTRFRREDYPELSEDEFVSKAGAGASSVVPALTHYLEQERANPESWVRFAVPEYLDAFPRYWKRMVTNTGEHGLVSRVALCQTVIDSADDREPAQVEVAKELLSGFENTDWSDPDIKHFVECGKTKDYYEIRKMGKRALAKLCRD